MNSGAETMSKSAGNKTATTAEGRQKPRKSPGRQRVKRFAKGGIEYVYHRMSGIRLPSLPDNHPHFIAALRRAEVEWQNAVIQPDQPITPVQPIDITHEVPLQFDAMVNTPVQAVSWAHKAKQGQVAHYHYGAIAEAAAKNPVVDAIRRYFALLREFEVVALRQSRTGPNHTHYYAIRTGNGLRGLPRNVITGTVQVIEYEAVRALTERQAAMSVARCLRNELMISESDAVEMRNDMIRRGWLTNGRPPELTTQGLSVLA